MMRFITYFAVAMLTLLSINHVSATHVIGGDLTYQCLGDDTYEFSLNFRRDCAFGDPEAGFDNPAVLGIFDSQGNLLTFLGENGGIELFFDQILPVESVANEFCAVDNPSVCVEETTYKGSIKLPFRAGGYIIAYQRCCRNQTLLNIVDPLETGTTYFVTIDDFAFTECNSSPVFNDWADIYACKDTPLIFDHSAVDPDGDELVYSLCTPVTGATIDQPMPQPPFQPDSPVYPYWTEVTWNNIFSTDNMFGVGTPLTIDPNTGVINAVPGMIGQFLIGICVQEFRDGQLIGTVIRDFEINVRQCNNMGVVDFDFVYEDCDNLVVQFENLSEEFNNFEWNFNFPNTDDANLLSTEVNPLITFPSPGIYQVQLNASNDSGCSLTIDKSINIDFGGVTSEFTIEISSCNETSVNLVLTDVTNSPDLNFEYESIEWEILLDGNPMNIVNQSIVNLDNVMFTNLEVTFTGVTAEGCVAISTQSTTLGDLLPQAAFDTTLVGCDGDNISVILTDTSVFNNLEPISWEWTITSDGVVQNLTGETISVDLLDGALVELFVTYDVGCTGYVSEVITLQGGLLPDLNFDIELAGCSDQGVQNASVFPVFLDDTDEIIESYEWTYLLDGLSQTSNDESINIQIIQDIDNPVTLVVNYQNGCSISYSETINPGDFITLVNITTSLADCEVEDGVLDVILTAELSGVINPVESYEWTSIIDGTEFTSTGETVQFALDLGSSAVATVLVTYTNGCSSLVTTSISADDLIPVLDIVVLESSCDADGTVTATLGYTSGNVDTTSQSWNVNGQTGTEPTITITADQSAEVTATVTVILDNGCPLTLTEVLGMDELLGPTPVIDVQLNDCSDLGNVSITLVNATPLSTITTLQSLVWNYSIDGVAFSSTDPQVDLMLDSEAQLDILLTLNYDNGCTVTTTLTGADLMIPSVEWTSDPIVSCEGNSVALVANPNSAWTYEWSPLDGLIFDSTTDFSNPTVEASGMATYNVTVTNGICSIEDSIDVITMDGLELNVVGDTDICGDAFTLSVDDPIPGIIYEWSDTPTFDVILATGDTFSGTIDLAIGSGVFYVRIQGDNPLCLVGIQEITVTNRNLDIEVVDPFTLCILDTVTYFVINNDPMQELTFVWDDNPNIVEIIDEVMPVIGAGANPESFTLTFTATNQFGCTMDGELNIVVADQPQLNFEYTIEDCGELTVCFTPEGNQSNLYIWDFGDTGNPGNEAIGQDQCYTYSDFGTYTVNLSGVGSVCSGIPYSETITLSEDEGTEIISNGISVDSSTVCIGDLLTLTLAEQVDEDFVTWCDDQGATIGSGGQIVLTALGNNQWMVEGSSEVITTIDIVLKVTYNTSCQFTDSVSIGTFDFGPETDITAFEVIYNGFNCETGLACFQANTDANNTIIWLLEGQGVQMTAVGNSFQCFDLTGAPMGMYTVSVSAPDAPCTIDPFSITVEITTMGFVGVIGAIDDVINYCVGDEVTLTGTTNIEGGQISWCDADGNELATGETYTFTPSGPIDLAVKLDGDNNCVDTTVLMILPYDFGPGTDNTQLDFTYSQEDCTNTEVCFEANTAAAGNLVWTISGMGISDQILVDQFPCYDFAAGGTGSYTVTLSAPDAPCPIDPITQTIIVGGDTDLDILGLNDGVLNYCVGDSVTAVATTTVMNPEINWCVDGDVVATGETYTFFGSDVTELTVKLGSGSNCGDTLLVDVVPYDFGIGTDIDSLTYSIAQPDCESLEVCFTANTNADDNLIWDITGAGFADQIVGGQMICYTVPTSGEYSMTLSAPGAPCPLLSTSQTFEVYDMIANVIIDGPETVLFCEEGMLTLTATSNIGDENITWCDADGNEVGSGGSLEVVFDGTTTYTAKAGTIPACSSIDVVTITGFNLGDAVISAPDVACDDEGITASIDGLLDGDYSYEWSPAECVIGDTTGPTAVINGSGLKTIQVMITENGTGCTATLNHDIIFSTFGIIDIEAIENDTIFLGNDVTINVINGDPNWTYDWSTGESGIGLISITDTPIESMIYSVTITDENGCMSIMEILVTVLQPSCDETDIYLPNAFTPNGDTTNDVLFVRSNFVSELEFFVFNRWGEEIFRTTDINRGWDGTYNGELLTPDVYAYCLKVTCPNDEKYVKTGNVSLLR